ncbi:hypothetical protein IU46_021685 [Pantoea agglomerans]|nr:hypothetical protein IU46_021685 [Pantoea agglomerans]
MVKRDEEAAAQASGDVFTHGADAKTERKRDGSKRGGGSANGRRRRALPQGDRATVKSRHRPQHARTGFSALSRRMAE